MRLFFPVTKAGDRGREMSGTLAGIEWTEVENVRFLSLKVSVPDFSMIQNFYFLLDESEVEAIALAEGSKVIRMKAELLDEILACQNPGQIFPILKRAHEKILVEMGEKT